MSSILLEVLDEYDNLLKNCEEIVTRSCAGTMLMLDRQGRLNGVRCYHSKFEEGEWVNIPCDCKEVEDISALTGIVPINGPYFHLSERARKIRKEGKLQFNFLILSKQKEAMMKAKKSGNFFVLNPCRSGMVV